MPGLTRYPGEGGPRIVQQPLSSGLRPMTTMVIRLGPFVLVHGSLGPNIRRMRCQSDGDS
jgi:hypothetical protein